MRKWCCRCLLNFIIALPSLACHRHSSKSSQVYSLNGKRCCRRRCWVIIALQSNLQRGAKLCRSQVTLHFLPTLNKACFNTWGRTFYVKCFISSFCNKLLFFPNLRCKRWLKSKHWIMRDLPITFFVTKSPTKVIFASKLFYNCKFSSHEW